MSALLRWSAALLLAAAPLAAAADELVERGRYLATAADCAACHTRPDGGKPYAGGYAIQSPMGAIWSTNITASKAHGIGGYTEAQFARALRDGIRADGAHLYPAMPYTAYAKLSDEDVRALYAYFTQAVPAVEEAAPETRLSFPFNLRFSMAAWNALFLDGKRFTPDPARDAQWNRGAYLVEALEHCSSCHTPRGLLMQEQQGNAYAGGAVGGWYAPNITSDKVSGIGAWSDAELHQYLRSGRVPGKAQAAGGMAEAITHSLSKLQDDDLSAIVAYLRTVPPKATDGARKAAFEWEGAPLDEARLRGAGASLQAGATLYSGLCASCHGVQGRGGVDAYYPSLVRNSTVGAPQPQNLVAAILYGVDREVDGHHVLMPHFSEGSYVQTLDDAQVAAVATYVRQAFGPGGEVSAEDVARVRRGGDQPLLVTLAGWLPAGLAVLVLLCVVWLVRRRARRSGRAGGAA